MLLQVRPHKKRLVGNHSIRIKIISNAPSDFVKRHFAPPNYSQQSVRFHLVFSTEYLEQLDEQGPVLLQRLELVLEGVFSAAVSVLIDDALFVFLEASCTRSSSYALLHASQS